MTSLFGCIRIPYDIILDTNFPRCASSWASIDGAQRTTALRPSLGRRCWHRHGGIGTSYGRDVHVTQDGSRVQGCHGSKCLASLTMDMEGRWFWVIYSIFVFGFCLFIGTHWIVGLLGYFMFLFAIFDEQVQLHTITPIVNIQRLLHVF